MVKDITSSPRLKCLSTGTMELPGVANQEAHARVSSHMTMWTSADPVDHNQLVSNWRLHG